MNLTQLRAFHLVATAGSFSVAARTGGVSQPTLSAQVKGLETTYGVSLFDRKGRGAQLTPLGHSLHQITTTLFQAEDEARDLLAGNRWVTRGHLRVAADSAYHVMPVLAAMRDRHRGLTFQMRIDNSANVLAQVLGFEADVAVTALPTSDPRVTAESLRRDRLVLFVPRTHPWAARDAIMAAEIEGCDLVIRERGSITREVFETRLAQDGIRPGALFEVQTREAVREAVGAGFGVGVVFESEFGTDPRFKPLSLVEGGLEVGEYVVCLTERRRLALVSAFFDAAHRLARQEGWLEERAPSPAATPA
ncbi:LysR substrate-binding domain-containing protein [Alsobacter soli]|nr:LysR substrate-binding domain-containing protein [Alsobacter soli]